MSPSLLIPLIVSLHSLHTNARTNTLPLPSTTLLTTYYRTIQVKTTQPRRYLVRPNQGLIGPGGSETVQIILVEKDKASLLQSYQRLGQSALDHSKDKFLVQSCTVSTDFSNDFVPGDSGYDALSTLWTEATASGSATAVANKKLHVRHSVEHDSAKGGGDTNTKGAAHVTMSVQKQQHHEPQVSLSVMQAMSHADLLAQVTQLRRKYDELVAFSVNLTAERDILNNTLEQTKRDLNREMTKSAASGNSSNNSKMARGGTGSGGNAGSSLSTMNLQHLLVVGIVLFLVGVRLEQMGSAGFVQMIPVLGRFFGAAMDDAGPEPEL